MPFKSLVVGADATAVNSRDAALHGARPDGRHAGPGLSRRAHRVEEIPRDRSGAPAKLPRPARPCGHGG